MLTVSQQSVQGQDSPRSTAGGVSADIHCLIASLLPFLDAAQIGVDDEKRALTEKHVERNPEWQALFMVQ